MIPKCQSFPRAHIKEQTLPSFTSPVGFSLSHLDDQLPRVSTHQPAVFGDESHHGGRAEDGDSRGGRHAHAGAEVQVGGLDPVTDILRPHTETHTDRMALFINLFHHIRWDICPIYERTPTPKVKASVPKFYLGGRGEY